VTATHRLHVDVEQLELALLVAPAVDTTDCPELHDLSGTSDTFLDSCIFDGVLGVLFRSDGSRVFRDWLHAVVWRDVVDVLRPNDDGQSPVSLLLSYRCLKTP
jgi:hypothetical protein